MLILLFRIFYWLSSYSSTSLIMAFWANVRYYYQVNSFYLWFSVLKMESWKTKPINKLVCIDWYSFLGTTTRFGNLHNYTNVTNIFRYVLVSINRYFKLHNLLSISITLHTFFKLTLQIPTIISVRVYKRYCNLELWKLLK